MQIVNVNDSKTEVPEETGDRIRKLLIELVEKQYKVKCYSDEAENEESSHS